MIHEYPFPLPADFLRRLGYETYEMPPGVGEMLRKHFDAEPELFQPRRFVGVYWEMCGDEAAWDDGRHSVCGADWTVLLEVLHDRRVSAWLDENRLDLGSSEDPPRHWLICDREAGTAYVADVLMALRIVQQQRLEAEE